MDLSSIQLVKLLEQTDTGEQGCKCLHSNLTSIGGDTGTTSALFSLLFFVGTGGLVELLVCLYLRQYLSDSGAVNCNLALLGLF